MEMICYLFYYMVVKQFVLRTDIHSNHDHHSMHMYLCVFLSFL